MPVFSRDDTDAILRYYEQAGGGTTRTTTTRGTTGGVSLSDNVRSQPATRAPATPTNVVSYSDQLRSQPTYQPPRQPTYSGPPARQSYTPARQPAYGGPRDEQYYTQATPPAAPKPVVKPPVVNRVPLSDHLRSAPAPARRLPAYGGPDDEQFYTQHTPTRPAYTPPVVRGPSPLSDRLAPTYTPRFQYEVNQPAPIGLSYERPALGAPGIQQSGATGPTTVTSRQRPYIPYAPAYGGPEDEQFYTTSEPLREWLPPESGLVNPVAGPPVARNDLSLSDRLRPTYEPSLWYQMRNANDPFDAEALAMWNALDDSTYDTAARERARHDIEERNAAFGQRSRSTLGDLWNSLGDAWSAGFVNNEIAQRELGQYMRGEQPLGQAVTDYWRDADVTAGFRPLWYAADINPTSANLGRQTNNLMSGIQAGADLMYNYPYLPSNLPPSAYVASGWDIFSNPPKPLEQAAGSPSGLLDFWGELTKAYADRLGVYRAAVTPTPAEAARMTPLELQRNQERAWLNTLGGVKSVENTFDALVNQQQRADALWANAQQLFLDGANAPDPTVRQKYWYEAAQMGSDAWRLQNAHPVDIVNENTNILRQMLFEMALPDVTDIVSGLFSLTKLTPKARRLTVAADEFMTPAEEAVTRLQNMIITPENKAAVLAQRGDYNKFFNLWSTGTARAHIATDQMHRFLTTLLSNVDSPSDARILLNQIAENPTKLVTGMPATLFQSSALRARGAADGLVRLGSMGLENIKEPLRIYQQMAQDFLANSRALQGGPLLNKIDLMTEYADAMNQAGYRFYNVADVAETLPPGVKSARLKSAPGNQYIVEYLGEGKKVLRESPPMPLGEAQKIQTGIRSGQAVPRSLLNQAGSTMRKIVSPLYIMLNPGTWIGNVVNSTATALGDGVWSTMSVGNIKNRVNKLFAVDPTVRGFEGAMTGMGQASQMAGGVWSTLRRMYGNLDERTGQKVFMASVDHALRDVGKPALSEALTPILKQMGIGKPREVTRIVNHLFEVGYRGEDMLGEWMRLMQGNTRVFSLSDVNPTWLGALSEPALEEFHTILRTAASREEAIAQLTQWKNRAAKYWDELLSSTQAAPQRHVWMKQEVAQDAGDLTQMGRMAHKYGNVPAEEVTAAIQPIQAGLQAAVQRMQTLMQLVADAGKPENRYILYNVWGEVNDLTASVRHQLNGLAEKVTQLPRGERSAAWRDYFAQAQQLWAERNTTVNTLLERAAKNVSEGADFTPQLSVWRKLEEAASESEPELWRTLQLEPQSGVYDDRLHQVIDAGRAISDKAMARVYAAARRFANVDAMDYIVSAEHEVQMAGRKARVYLDRVLDQVASSKGQNWERYFHIRNEVWRQLRQYEKDVWGLAERNIVRDGLANETVTGLRFDAGPDGMVELIRPEPIPTQKTMKLGQTTERTTEELPYWTVRRADGTVTRLPENLVPEDLRTRYQKLGDEVETQVELELDNIASAHPFEADAQKVLDGEPLPTTTDVGGAVGPLEEGAGQVPPQTLEAPTVKPITLNDLRKAAKDAGIPTVTNRGKPLDTALWNYVKKTFKDNNLALSASRLADMTQEQLGQALAFLGERADVAKASDLYRVEKGAARETAKELAAMWDKEATATIGVPRLETLAKKYRKGERTFEFEDLYGRTVAGMPIENSNDVLKLVGQYVRLQDQANAAGKAIQATQRYVGMSKAEILRERGQDLVKAGFDTAELQTRSRSDILRFLEQLDNQVQRDAKMITYEYAIPDPYAWARQRVGKQLDLSAGLKRGQAAERMTTAAGGAVAGDIGLGAAHAQRQIENIYNHVVDHIDEILAPVEGLSPNQALAALDTFRKEVMPRWDNVKMTAAEYGNRMRSFVLVDFINNTRLDELLGLYMPYGFWTTRTMKNSLERAIFEPHIWRRMMQSEQAINDMQEQRGDPQRYEGFVPVDLGKGMTYYLRLLPSKYWPTFGIFTQNDYADPESANSAAGYAFESMRAANLNAYPWWDALYKLSEGKGNEIYPVNYFPQSRMLTDVAIMLLGADAAQIAMPGFFENSVARELNNMAVRGEITRDEARWAHDLLWQLKNSGQPLPEQSTIAPMDKLTAILDRAMQSAAGKDLTQAASSWLTGIGVKPFDQSEKIWTGAQQEYFDNRYGSQNHYGSHLGSTATEEDAKLAWSKSAVWKPNEQRPGVHLVNDIKERDKEAINQELMQATDAWLSKQTEDPTNGEINKFKTEYINQKLGTNADYFVEGIKGYLEETYPSSAYPERKGPKYQGYAPEELREVARTQAYYQAKEEIAAPTWPGTGKSRDEYKAYYDAKAQYELALEERVNELINDPVALRRLAGLPVTNAPTSLSDYLRSNSEDTITMSNAFGYPVRPTGQGPGSEMAGPVKLAGSPETAADIIEQEQTKYMSELEKEVRARNDEKGDRSGGYTKRSYGRRDYSSRRGGRRYYSRGRGYGGGGYYGGGGGGGGGGGSYFANVPWPDARGLNSSLWTTDAIREWRPWNNANDWLSSGRDLGPGPLRDWRPIKI